MLDSVSIRHAEVATVTFDPIVSFLMGLLIGLLLGLIVGSWGSVRTPPHPFNWLTTHDRIMSGLLIVAAFAVGVFMAIVLLR